MVGIHPVRLQPLGATARHTARPGSIPQALVAALAFLFLSFLPFLNLPTREFPCLLLDLHGKRGLVVGIANDQSIAWGCARAFRDAGAELAVTWLNDKARAYVEALARQVDAPITLPLDVEQPGQMEAVFGAVAREWGRLDFVLHSIAFAPRSDLSGRVTDSSREGFARAMDISCHSFLRMARLAEPLMPQGGSLMTMSYVGAAEVIPGYGVMGPVKAALESGTRYLAAELGPKGIRVNAVSPGRWPRGRPPAFPTSTRSWRMPCGGHRCAAWWSWRRSARCAPSWPATVRGPSPAIRCTWMRATISWADRAGGRPAGVAFQRCRGAGVPAAGARRARISPAAPAA